MGLMNISPFNFEQAANWLKDIKANLERRVKKAVKDDAKISMALPQDRAKYLSYAIRFLDRVDSEHINLFYKVTGRIPSTYSEAELAEMFRKLLVLRVNGYSVERIAKHLHTPVDTMKKVELIAVSAISVAIKKARAEEIPILGG